MTEHRDDYIFTLVAADSPLAIGHIAEAERFMQQNAITVTAAPRWIKDHKAATMTLDTKPTMAHIHELRRLYESDKIDIFVIPAANYQNKKLLIADMDSTIVKGETLDDLAAFAGLKDKIAAITARAMAGELDFADALRERVALLKDLPADALQKTLAQTYLNQGAQTLIQTLRSHDITCVLASGGLTVFTGYIAEKAGFDAHHGNILTIENGVLTGTVAEPILDKDAKVTILHHYTQERGIDLRQTIAIGDGANDLPMLQIAGTGFGYHPKPVILNHVDNCIIHGDLTAMLYALGYN